MSLAGKCSLSLRRCELRSGGSNSTGEKDCNEREEEVRGGRGGGRGRVRREGRMLECKLKMEKGTMAPTASGYLLPYWAWHTGY